MNQFESDILQCNEIKKHIYKLTKKLLTCSKLEQRILHEEFILQYTKDLKKWEKKLIDTHDLQLPYHFNKHI